MQWPLLSIWIIYTLFSSLYKSQQLSIKSLKIVRGCTSLCRYESYIHVSIWVIRFESKPSFGIVFFDMNIAALFHDGLECPTMSKRSFRRIQCLLGKTLKQWDLAFRTTKPPKIWIHQPATSLSEATHIFVKSYKHELWTTYIHAECI